jgi:ribosomal protein S18 acetylase RimI-like enzyme
MTPKKPKRDYPVQLRHEFMIVSEENEQVCTATLEPRADGLYLTGMWTHHKHRRQGLASKVLSAVTQQFADHDIYLMVGAYTDQPLNNEQLVAFYQRFGFEVVGPMGLMCRKGNQS